MSSSGINKKVTTRDLENNINNTFLSALKRMNINPQQIKENNIFLYNDQFAQISSFPSTITGSYFSFSLNTHYEDQVELSKILREKDVFKANFKLEYNFLIKQYEESISKVETLKLPYFYDVVNEQILPTETIFDSRKYFEETDFSQNESVSNVIYFDSKIPLISEKMALSKYLATANPAKEQFPLYANIKFNNHNLKTISTLRNLTNTIVTNFTSILNDYNLFVSFFKNYQDNKLINQVIQKIEKINPLTGVFRENGGNEFRVEDIFRATRIFALKVPMDGSFFKNLYSISDQVQSSRGSIGQSFQYFQKIIELLGTFNKFIDVNKLSFNDVLKQNNCYSEVFGYKLYKYEGSSSNPVQEWYVPNVLQELIELVDTQVKYNNEYRYKLSILTAVLGCDYNFSINKQEKKITFSIIPSLKIYEIDSCEYKNILLDSPPVAPELEIIPYVGISDKVKININTGVGSGEQIPIVFKPEESDQIEKFRISQNRTDKKIFYQSDEPNVEFQIYRLETEPKNYEDFALIDPIVVTNKGSSAAAYEDKISQNKKYYYTFRGIDYHKNVSNPSEIYLVELVNDNGSIYPLISIYEQGKDNLLETFKPFRRFLSITPSYANKVFNQTAEDFRSQNDTESIGKRVKLGINNPATWDKKFKIRLTSKSTGKKIDINVVFDKKKKAQ